MHVVTQPSREASSSSQNPPPFAEIPVTKSEVSDGSRDCYEKVQSWIQVLHDESLDPVEEEVHACPSPSPSFDSTGAVWLTASETESMSLVVDGDADADANIVNEHSDSAAQPDSEAGVNNEQVLKVFDKNGIDSWRHSISDDTQSKILYQSSED